MSLKKELEDRIRETKLEFIRAQIEKIRPQLEEITDLANEAGIDLVQYLKETEKEKLPSIKERTRHSSKERKYAIYREANENYRPIIERVIKGLSSKTPTSVEEITRAVNREVRASGIRPRLSVRRLGNLLKKYARRGNLQYVGSGLYQNSGKARKGGNNLAELTNDPRYEKALGILKDGTLSAENLEGNQYRNGRYLTRLFNSSLREQLGLARTSRRPYVYHIDLTKAKKREVKSKGNVVLNTLDHYRKENSMVSTIKLAELLKAENVSLKEKYYFVRHLGELGYSYNKSTDELKLK